MTTLQHRLQLRLLGPVTVWDQAGHRLAAGARPQRTLLALFALRPNQSWSVDQLIEAIWQGELPSRPRSALHTRVSRLRKWLGDTNPSEPIIELSDDRYRLRLDPDAIDYHRFERLAKRAIQRDDQVDRSELIEMLTSFNSEPFSDVTPITELFDAGERVRQLRISAVVTLAQRIAVSDPVGAIELIENGLRLEPYSEQLMAIRLTLTAPSDDATALSRRFQRWRQDYRSMFHCEPPTSLLDAANALRSPRAVHAQRVASELGGTQRQLSVLSQSALIGTQPARILAARRPVLLIEGAAGCGKSTLAAHWLATAQPVVDQLVVGFSELGDPFEMVAGPLVHQTIDEHVDPAQFARRRCEAITESLRQQLGQGPIQLVLDDVHNARDADAVVIESLVMLASEQLRICVTTRPFPASGDVDALLKRLHALPSVTTARLDHFSATDVVDLVADRLPTWEAEQQTLFAQRLYEHTAGHQLLVDATARRAEVLDPASAIELFTSAEAADPLAPLVRELAELERRLAQLLAVARLPLSVAELSVITGDTAAEISQSLRALRNRGLLRQSDDRWIIAHSLVADSVMADSVDDHARALADWYGARDDRTNALRLRALDSESDTMELAASLSDHLEHLLTAGDMMTAAKLADAVHEAALASSEPSREVVQAWLVAARAHEYLGERGRADDYCELAMQAAIQLADASRVVTAGIGSGILGRSRVDAAAQRRLLVAKAWIDEHGSADQQATVLLEQLSRRFSASRVVTPTEADELGALAQSDRHRAGAAMAAVWASFAEPGLADKHLETVVRAKKLSQHPDDRDIHLLACQMEVELRVRGGELEQATEACRHLIGLAHIELRPRSQWLATCAEASLALLAHRRSDWLSKLAEATRLGSEYHLADAAPVRVAQLISGELVGWSVDESPPTSGVDFEDVADDPAVAVALAWAARTADPDAATALLIDTLASLPLATDRPLHRAAAVMAAYLVNELDLDDHAAAAAQLLEPFSGEIATAGVTSAAFGPVDAALTLLYRRIGNHERAERALTSLDLLAARNSAPHWLRLVA